MSLHGSGNVGRRCGLPSRGHLPPQSLEKPPQRQPCGPLLLFLWLFHSKRVTWGHSTCQSHFPVSRASTKSTGRKMLPYSLLCKSSWLKFEKRKKNVATYETNGCQPVRTGSRCVYWVTFGNIFVFGGNWGRDPLSAQKAYLSCWRPTLPAAPTQWTQSVKQSTLLTC